MAQVTIDERVCRGCTLCVDICPGLVFENDTESRTAKVMRAPDCIGCMSCVYICPAACIAVKSGASSFSPPHDSAAVL